MALEIVDDLDTPGCANCAVKHLSAALAHLITSLRAGLGHNGNLGYDSGRELVARACINLVEAAEGYVSHFPFAIGLLTMAEEAFVLDGDVEAALQVREERTSLIAGGMQATGSALDGLTVMVSGRDMARGHLEEAKRELPHWESCSLKVDELVAAIDEIRKEYFEFDEPGKKGGE